MNALMQALFDAGLIQYGLFLDGANAKPFQHQLAMLASYPLLLRETARHMSTLVSGVDRLLCAETAAPLGTAMALETGIPLVIGRGDQRDGARDLVGAFDIGHPAALIELGQGETTAALIEHAHRFGLNVTHSLAILAHLPAAAPNRVLADVGTVTREIVEAGRLPSGLGRAVEEWLTTLPRRD